MYRLESLTPAWSEVFVAEVLHVRVHGVVVVQQIGVFLLDRRQHARLGDRLLLITALAFLIIASVFAVAQETDSVALLEFLEFQR